MKRVSAFMAGIMYGGWLGFYAAVRLIIWDLRQEAPANIAEAIKPGALDHVVGTFTLFMLGMLVFTFAMQIALFSVSLTPRQTLWLVKFKAWAWNNSIGRIWSKYREQISDCRFCKGTGVTERLRGSLLRPETCFFCNGAGAALKRIAATGAMAILICMAGFGADKKEAKHAKIAKVHRIGVNKQPRQINVEENTVAEIYTAPGYETQVNLPPDVVIRQFGVGDGKHWYSACGISPIADTGRKNICRIKPGLAGQFSNLNVDTEDGGTYSLSLVPATDENPIDLKVFVGRSSRMLMASNGTAGFANGTMVPKAELMACDAHAQRDRDQLSRAEKELSEAGMRIAAMLDPSTMKFDYKIKHPRWGHDSEESMIGHDESRTAVFTGGRVMVYAKDNGKSVLVADCAGPCVVPRVLESGYFTSGIGKKRVKFERRKKDAHHG